MISRDQIATALSSVDGVTGSAQRPSAVTFGAAWPRWRSSVPLNARPGCGFTARWYVFVSLVASDLAVTLESSEPLIGSVTDALLELGLGVEIVEPVLERAEQGGGEIPLLRWSCVDQ